MHVPPPPTPSMSNSREDGFYIYIINNHWHIAQLPVSELIIRVVSPLNTAPTVVSQTYLGITCQGLGMGTNELPAKARTALQHTSASQVWPYMHQLRIIVLGQ